MCQPRPDHRFSCTAVRTTSTTRKEFALLFDRSINQSIFEEEEKKNAIKIILR